MTPNSIRAIAAAFVLVAAAGSATAQERAFDFALIGDMPYTKVQEREYQRVLAALNAADLAFVAHIGDFQFDATPYNQNPAIASMPCVDENYKAIYDSFQSIRHPFILTPGDNDWSDCWPLAGARRSIRSSCWPKSAPCSFPKARASGRSRSRCGTSLPIRSSPSSARTCAGPWAASRSSLSTSSARTTISAARRRWTPSIWSARPPTSPGSSKPSPRPRRPTAAAS